MDRYDTVKTQIQQRIREQRKKMKITQEGLSKSLNKSRFWVTAIERGNIIPTILSIYKIADALKCSIFDILPPNLDINNVSQNIDSKARGQVYSMLDKTHRELQNGII